MHRGGQRTARAGRAPRRAGGAALHGRRGRRRHQNGERHHRRLRVELPEARRDLMEVADQRHAPDDAPERREPGFQVRRVVWVRLPDAHGFNYGHVPGRRRGRQDHGRSYFCLGF